MNETRLYTPPEGFYDQPFMWIYDGSDLTAGSDALNRTVPIPAGYGHFVLRRVAGLRQVIAANGRIQIRDSSLNYLESAPVYPSPASDELAITPEITYPEKNAIRFDLYGALPGSNAGPATSPPALIDTLNGQMHQDGDDLEGSLFSGNGGSTQCWRIGGALYALLSESVITSHARMFKSTDEGQTWTAQDIANEPGTVGGLFLANDVKTARLGTKIYALWKTIPVPLQTHWVVNSFDTTTGLWDTQSVPGPLNLTSTKYVEMAVLSTGDVYVIMTGVSANVVYLKLSSLGVWDVAVTDVSAIAVNVTGTARMLLVDSSDRMHLVYQETNSATNLSDLIYVQISSTGVVGLPTTLLVGTVPFGVYNVGDGTIWQGNQLIVPYQRRDDNITTILSGTPLAAPVFTPTLVDPGASTVPVGGAAFYPDATLDNAGNLNVFWATNSTANADDRVWTAVNDGAGFTSPVVFYSNATNPPPGQDPLSPGLIQTSSPTLLSNGQFGLLWDAVITTPGIGGTASFFLVPGGGSVATAQLCFHGVSRHSGKLPLLVKPYTFKRKAYTYIQQITLSSLLTASVFNVVTDYDFEFYQLIITYSSAGTLPSVVCTVLLYDPVRQFLSNIPALDVFYNGAPFSEYQNGAQVPVLTYLRQSSIRADLTPVVTDSLLPITATLHFVGANKIPC